MAEDRVQVHISELFIFCIPVLHIEVLQIVIMILLVINSHYFIETVFLMNRLLLSFLVVLSLLIQSVPSFATSSDDEEVPTSSSTVVRSPSSDTLREEDFVIIESTATDPNAVLNEEEELDLTGWNFIPEPQKLLSDEEVAALPLEEILAYTKRLREMLEDAEGLRKAEEAYRQLMDDVANGRVTLPGNYYYIRDAWRIVGNVVSNPFIQMGLTFTGVRLLSDGATYLLAPRYVEYIGSSARAASEGSMLGRIPGVGNVVGDRKSVV